MPASNTGGGVRVEVDEAQFRELMQSIKEFDPKLARSLRKRLRAIGLDIVDAMRAEVKKQPPSGGRSRGSHSSRDQVAAGLGVRIATAKRKQGVYVTGSSKKMAPGRQAFPRLYNKARFRHPVFAMPEKRVTRWVYQQGNPYFGHIINKFEERAQKDVLEALQDAVDTLSHGV